MLDETFRGLALSLPEVFESAHMGHPDFRVRGKIFATMGAKDGHGMVKLSPEEQGVFMRTEPEVFKPAAGAWGRKGCTLVVLAKASEPSVRQALIAAWRNTAPKRLVNEFDNP
jgi:hypothetical protein